MNPKEQRIAIADACGWKGPEHKEVKKHVATWTKPEIWFMHPNGLLKWINDIPDYLNDLNAMHEAEKLLRKVIYPTDTDTIIGDRMHNYVELLNYELDATAARRAEAFLKTLNLWKE